MCLGGEPQYGYQNRFAGLPTKQVNKNMEVGIQWELRALCYVTRSPNFSSIL